VAQQNALVQKYCAVCHSDAQKNGGLSLEHFDAAQVESSLAAMLVSKLKNGAIGAAGLSAPDDATQNGLMSALAAKSAGATEWHLTRTQDPKTQTTTLTASILREDAVHSELYRLKLTCRLDTREAEMQLSWAPNAGDSARTMTVAIDGNSTLTYKIEGRERMGNGSKTADGKEVTTGPAATVLYATRPTPGSTNLSMPLPAQTLTVSSLFPDQIVVFPFDRMTPAMRKDLSQCFSASSGQ
jgi:hypothetical protein